MERLGLGLLAAGLGIVGVMLAARSRQAARQRSEQRARFFDDCGAVLSETRIAWASSGFPRLAGRYQSHEVDLQAVPDTLTFRKLPALWVMVTLPEPLPVKATLDLMIRPTGVEPFSNFHLLSDQITTPPGYPADCAIRTDDRVEVIPESILRPHLTLFDDEQIKELVISPKGLRVTFLSEEANRGRYLIFRDSEMGRSPLPPDRVLPLIDRLLALRDDINALTPKGTTT